MRNEHDGLKEWMAATIIAITVTTTPVFGAERGPVIVEPRPPVIVEEPVEPRPPVIVEEPPAVVVAPPPVVEPRCRRQTVRKYDEDGDFQGTEETETCD
jgi:hypothetical protein